MSEFSRDFQCELPRDFQLMQEYENSSKFTGVSFGLTKKDDVSFTYWSGSFISSTAHTIQFTFVCDNNYPLSAPKITFDQSYKNIDIGSQEEEYQTILYKLKNILKADSTELDPDHKLTKMWYKKLGIGKYLQNIRKSLMS